MRKPTSKSEPSWTIDRLLNWTASYFQSHHIDSPRATAEILLAYALNMQRIELYMRYDQPLIPSELAAFRSLIRRRLQREPVAYIVGEKEFWSMALRVTPAVLIPRPETECLVEAALRLIPHAVGGHRWRVWDIGTGSGAIVLALAKERPAHHYWASDRSKTAIALARCNAVRHHLETSILFFGSVWFEAVRCGPSDFDLIVSNPPYIPQAGLLELQPEIVAHEPRMALDGGSHGLASLRTLVVGAAERLRPGGHLLLEIGHDQASAVQKLCEQNACFEHPRVIQDYSGHDRIMHLTRASG